MGSLALVLALVTPVGEEGGIASPVGRTFRG